MNEISILLKKLPLDQMGACVLIDLGDEKIYISQDGEVSKSMDQAVDLTIKLSKQDMLAVLQGEENVMSLFTMGRIEVDGEMDLAFRLKSILG
jgi:putative sterol carrier protein